MPPRLDDSKREAILAAIRAGGKSCRQITREHGVSADTVSKLGKSPAAGSDPFGRQQTEKATHAHLIDLKARRAGWQSRWLDLADHLADRVTLPYTHVVVTQAGPELVITKLPPLRDAQAAVIAAATAFDKHLRAVDFDTADANGELAGLLGTALDGIRSKYGVDAAEAGA